MKTPEERYNNDPQYAMMVNTLTALIHKCQFTPSELREMVVYACIRYELRYVARKVTIPYEVEEAFRTLDRYRRSEEVKCGPGDEKAAQV